MIPKNEVHDRINWLREIISKLDKSPKLSVESSGEEACVFHRFYSASDLLINDFVADVKWIRNRPQPIRE